MQPTESSFSARSVASGVCHAPRGRRQSGSRPLGRIAWAMACFFVLAISARSQSDAKVRPLPHIDFLYGDRELFPSALLCFTGTARLAPEDGDQVGDTRGVIAVKLRSPAAGAVVRVTLAETVFYAESHVVETLPAADTVYHVAPVVRFHADRLAAQKQPLANLVIRATVEVQTKPDAPVVRTELHEKVVVHSVNDLIQRYVPRPPANGGFADDWNYDAKYMIAGFVNENNPWIDQRITRHALTRSPKPYVEAFLGYQSPKKESVVREIGAVFDTLRDLGFRYSNFPQASAAPVAGTGRLRIQAIRLVGDSLESSQANGVETVTILASVFRKMGIDTVIFVLPPPADAPGTAGNTLLGIYTQRGQPADALVVIDPRALGYRTFDEAMQSGGELFKPARDQLLFSGPDADALRNIAETNGYFAIDIRQARNDGILPIPEIRREFSAAPRQP